MPSWGSPLTRRPFGGRCAFCAGAPAAAFRAGYAILTVVTSTTSILTEEFAQAAAAAGLRARRKALASATRLSLLTKRVGLSRNCRMAGCLRSVLSQGPHVNLT